MGDPTTDWPEFSPDIELALSVSGAGSLTLGSGSKLVNYADYTTVNNAVKGLLFVNGTQQADITFSSSDGSMSMSPSSVSVSSTDSIEVSFETYGGVSLPWYTVAYIARRVYWDIPASLPASVTFDSSTNTMPIPTFDLTFGWTTGDNFKAGLSVSNDDSASEDLYCRTRLAFQCPNQSSQTAIDLSSTSTQTHTSSFDRGDVQAGVELALVHKSGTGTTRQESWVVLTFMNPNEATDYPSGFPTSGVRLEQTKVGGGLKLAQP